MTLCLHQHTHFHFPNTHTHTHKHTCRCVTAFFTEVCVLSTCEAFKAARGLTMCLSAPHVHDNTCTSIIGATGSVAENCFPERHFLFQMMMSHIVSHTLIAHPERWRRKHSSNNSRSYEIERLFSDGATLLDMNVQLNRVQPSDARWSLQMCNSQNE